MPYFLKSHQIPGLEDTLAMSLSNADGKVLLLLYAQAPAAPMVAAGEQARMERKLNCSVGRSWRL